MVIRNLTPHDITIYDEIMRVVKVIPSSGVVRLSSKIVGVANADGIRITKTCYGEPEGLPKFKNGTYYIVSQLVKAALPKRKDLLVPAEVVRDENGNVLGCRSLGI